jgi:hypothetical protein
VGNKNFISAKPQPWDRILLFDRIIIFFSRLLDGISYPMREAVLRQRGVREVLFNFILMNLDQSTMDVQTAIAVANPTKTEWIFDEVVDL